VTRAPTELVKERREALQLTQKEAARRAGISRNEWNQMENGGRGIGPKNAVYGFLYATFGLGAALGAVTVGTYLAHHSKAKIARRSRRTRRVARLDRPSSARWLHSWRRSRATNRPPPQPDRWPASA